MVLDFYLRNLLDFAQYEPIDLDAASTLSYHERLLDVEYDLMCKNQLVRYFFFQKDNPFQIVGTVSFRNFNRAGHLQSAQIGYKVDQEFRRRGFAKEALYATCLDMLYTENFHRIEAWVLPYNTPSCRLLEGLGFVREGLMRDKVLLNGNWEDHYLYSLVP